MRIRNFSVLVVLMSLLVLAGCGGGGGDEPGGGRSPQPPVTTTDPSTVALGTVGKLEFPAGSLPVGAKVSVEATEAPLMIADLAPVGTVWKVTVTQQPLIPVEVSLPVPAGEDPDTLSLVHMSDDGEVTLLQTQVVNGMLVASTPGFSSIFAVRRGDRLLKYNPIIEGPDVLPVGVAGAYFEEGDPGLSGLNRKWSYRDLTTGSETGSRLYVEEGAYAGNRVGFVRRTPGESLIVVTYTEPLTGVSVRGQKKVRVVEKLDLADNTANRLDVAIYGPVVMSREDGVDVIGRVLNTDVGAVTSWSCSYTTVLGSLKSCGSCSNNCGKTFSVKQVAAGEVGSVKLEMEVYGPGGSYGRAVLPVRVVDHRFRIDSLEIARIARKWSPTIPHVFATADAVVSGGTAPYTYRWYLMSELVKEEVSEDAASSVEFSLNQPGIYRARVEIEDAAGNKDTAVGDFAFTPTDEDMNFHSAIGNLPGDDLLVNQDVSIELSAWGGFIIYAGRMDGYKEDGYFYVLDWGDGSPLERGMIEASKVLTPGTLLRTHRYLTPGKKTLRLATYLEVAAMTLDPQEMLDKAVKYPRVGRSSAELTVVEAPVVIPTGPSVGVCPQAVTAITLDGTLETQAFSNFTVSAKTKKARCEYGEGGRVFIDINYSTSSTDWGCKRAHMLTGGAYVSLYRGYSTERQVKAEVGSSNYRLRLQKIDNVEAVLTSLLNTVVQEGVGSVCPPQNLPEVTLTASDPSAIEKGLDPGVFTLTRSGDTSKPLLVRFEQTGTASPQRDFTISASKSLEIPAGASSTTITVLPVDDFAIESDETVILTLVPDLQYVNAGTGSATVTIRDRGAARLVLDRTEFVKSIHASDKCGDTQTCMRFVNTAQSRTAETFYNISFGTAEYRFDQTYDPSNTLTSEYRVTFSFDEPPQNIVAGSAVTLNIKGIAQGFVDCCSLGRRFMYSTARVGQREVPYGESIVYFYNRDLPYDDVRKRFEGTMTGATTTAVSIPETAGDGFAIIGTFGQDPALNIKWVYRLEEGLTNAP